MAEVLTKSDLQALLQCPRKLWLEHKRPDLIPKDDPGLYRRAMDGNIVGQKAREQLGKDVLWPPPHLEKEEAAAQAKAMLIKTPGKPAVEVPMVHGGLYARADALLPEGGKYILRETKTSTFPLKKDNVSPASPEDHHLCDLAIQAWTMEGAGHPLARAELNLLNGQWRYGGDGDYSLLFKQLDVTDEIEDFRVQVPAWRTQAEAVLGAAMPAVQTGGQCKKPHDCPFLSHCKKLDPPGPDHPIELLPDLAGKNLARKLRETKGYASILDPKPEELVGSQAALYRRIQTAHRTGKPVLEAGTDVLMNRLAYPRYYFDFEGIDLPVPRWKGVRPYEQIPFQWSCHIERAPGVFEHGEFLDLTGNDPSESCIDRMRSVIAPDDNGPIIVFYATYERGRLEDLATRHPQHAALMQKYIGRLLDLHPIVKEHFYHPDMRGSFSIKKVLPVIAPDLDYGELEEVNEGTGAQVAYLYATLDPETTPARKADLEAKLRKYCRQDTWAMVEVAYFLGRSPRPTRPANM